MNRHVDRQVDRQVVWFLKKKTAEVDEWVGHVNRD